LNDELEMIWKKAVVA